MEPTSDLNPAAELHSTSDTCPEPSVRSSWTTAEVILDTIFNFLPIPDLKNVRLTCQLWSEVGARTLTAKSTVRLANITFHAESRSRQYPRLNPEPLDEYLGSAHWADDFKPKQLIIYGCHKYCQLPQPQFSAVQQLEVTSFTPSQGSWLLHHQLPHFFPNLKSFKMSQLLPEPKPMLESCEKRNCPCMTSPSPPDAPLKHSSHSAELVLEKLSLEVAPIWTDISWDFFTSSGTLKALELAIGNQEPPPEWTRTLRNNNAQYFESVLNKIYTNILNLQRLEQVTLSFNLRTTPEMEMVVKLLNSLNLKKINLSLNIVQEHQLVLELIAGLNSSSIKALDTLHIPPKDNRINLLSQVFETLNKSGFFEKQEWDITYGGYSLWSWKARFWKTAKHFVFQLPEPPAPDVSGLIGSFFAQQGIFSSSNYNYAFLHVEGTPNARHSPFSGKKIPNSGRCAMNEAEIIDAAHLFKQEFLQVEWKCINGVRRPCGRCDYKLLCDIPGFVQEAGITIRCPDIFDNVRKAGGLDIFDNASKAGAWTFCKVPPEILAKWMERKELEIAATENLRPPCRGRHSYPPLTFGFGRTN